MRGLRQQNLPSVPRRRDARRPMDIQTHVALVGELRLARVEAHPDSNRPRRKGAPRILGRR